jgi:hypothetical protein
MPPFLGVVIDYRWNMLFSVLCDSVVNPLLEKVTFLKYKTIFKLSKPVKFSSEENAFCIFLSCNLDHFSLFKYTNK